MIGRLWNFVKRHKKKFIFTGAVVGGSIFALRVWLPRLQDRWLEHLLKELAQSAAGGDSAKTEEELQRERFQHKQTVSDSATRRKLASLRARQNQLFAEEECTAKVQKASDKESKLNAFKELQVECVAKATSALYTLHILLLLHRVGFNIVGRELQHQGSMSASSSKSNGSPQEHAKGLDADGFPGGETKGDDSHAVFLHLLDQLQGTRGQSGGSSADCCAQIAKAVKRAVRSCLNKDKLLPQTPMSEDAFAKLFTDICFEADRELITQSKGAAFLLPDGVEAGVADDDKKAQVRQLLDEARDYVDSPHFLQVFQAATHSASKFLAKGLCQELSSASAAGVAGPLPFAKFFGPLTKAAGAILEDSDGNEQKLGGASFVTRFSEEPRVAELCNGVYFQQARGSPQQQ